MHEAHDNTLAPEAMPVPPRRGNAMKKARPDVSANRTITWAPTSQTTLSVANA